MKHSTYCPRCNGRLVSGAKNCLHCGTLVSPGTTPASSPGGSSSGGGSIMSTLIILVAVLGLGGIILVGTGLSSGIDAVREGPQVMVGDAKVSATMCVSDDSPRIRDLGDEWVEIEGRDGMRCFQN